VPKSSPEMPRQIEVLPHRAIAIGRSCLSLPAARTGAKTAGTGHSDEGTMNQTHSDHAKGLGRHKREDAGLRDSPRLHRVGLFVGAASHPASGCKLLTRRIEEIVALLG
jgi:hypothetical protein